MLGFPVKDCTSGFRCYRREVIEKVDIDRLFSNGYSFWEEILYRCKQNQFIVGEIPIVFVDRKWGKSKISKKEIIYAVLTLLRLRLG